MLRTASATDLDINEANELSCTRHAAFEKQDSVLQNVQHE